MQQGSKVELRFQIKQLENRGEALDLEVKHLLEENIKLAADKDLRKREARRLLRMLNELTNMILELEK